MHFYEYQGKELLDAYRIPTPRRFLVREGESVIPFAGPYVIKAQVLFGNRKDAGGILFASTAHAAKKHIHMLLGRNLLGERITSALVEEKIQTSDEYYVSFSYDTVSRGPVFILSAHGGSDLKETTTFPIDLARKESSYAAFFQKALLKNGFSTSDIIPLTAFISRLWELFLSEHALLAEINPILRTASNQFVAGDAKIILDDAKVKPKERRFYDLKGDIAILASGGGASLLNIDTLISFGGRPANYTEYSGNPPADTVRDLTMRVLAQKNLKGCWVIGGTANFTDIYETMRGFLDGLHRSKPQPKFPIVIRRDGPRFNEAATMLRAAAQKGNYNMHIFGSETSMAESARIMVDLAYKK
jgi:succinyl-CoA synthetase beta subunit